MPSTFLGLNTGGSGLTYFQSALNTTAHNVANQKTKGYSRQQVLSRAADAIRLNSSVGMQGTGVSVQGVTQIRDAYYDAKYRDSMSHYAEYNTKNTYLLEIENYLNEMQSESGYTSLFTNISDSIQEVAKDPYNPTTRTEFLQALNNMTDFINETADNLQSTQASANDEIALYVDKINSLGKQVYSLTEQIINIEVRGGNANDLRDQRALVVDQLSEIVNVNVVEESINFGTGKDAVESGASKYTVSINGHVLVDDMGYNKLTCIPRNEKVNQNDVDGLYDVYWAGLNDTIGNKFDLNNGNLSGKLKGLFEVRDGNNAELISGSVLGVGNINTTTGKGNSVMISADAVDINKLNIADKGCITINSKLYYYDGWSANADADGNVSGFTFSNLTTLDETGKEIPAEIDPMENAGKKVSIGDSISFKGVPYYMAELNEFVRTFSRYMNDIHSDSAGVDSDGNQGLDLFSTTSPTGTDYEFTTGAGLINNGTDTYYRLTALNWGVNSAIEKDINKLVVAIKQDVDEGNNEKTDILDRLIAGLSDSKMFKEGTGSQFIESMTTSLSVDTNKTGLFAKNQDDIVNVIDQQRMSISSVDSNEESSNLITLQKGYNLACQVISVLDEVYDKLINGTAV